MPSLIDIEADAASGFSEFLSRGFADLHDRILSEHSRLQHEIHELRTQLVDHSLAKKQNSVEWKAPLDSNGWCVGEVERNELFLFGLQRTAAQPDAVKSLLTFEDTDNNSCPTPRCKDLQCSQGDESALAETPRARSSTRKSTKSNPFGLVTSGCFNCWEVWTNGFRPSLTMPAMSHTSTDPDVKKKFSNTTFDWGSSDTDGKVSQRYTSRLKCILAPTNPVIVVWDICFIVVIMYDCVTIPLALVEPLEDLFFQIMSWVTLWFWTLTIPVSFCTGFMRRDGVIEVRWTRVAMRYFRTWFLFDILIVVIDWVDAAAQQHDLLGSLRILKTSRSLKVLRMLRLARIVKLPYLVNHMQFGSQMARLCASVVNISLCIVLVAHMIACLWYSIGHMGEKRWHKHSQKEKDDCGSNDNIVSDTRRALDCSFGWIVEHNLQQSSFITRYSASFHWALTQFTGNESILPTNDDERWFAICVLLFAYVSSAGFISGITASLTRFSIISSRQSSQFATLQRYLNQHNLSAELSLRVTQAAQFASAKQQRNMAEKEVELLELVTAPLRAEIHYEVYAPVLTCHLFFRYYHRLNQLAVQKTCHAACGELPLAGSDVLFSEGERPEHPQMFFMMSGRILYMKREMKVPMRQNEGWFCEAPLWCRWVYLGACKAHEHTSLLSLDAMKFHKAALEYHGEVLYPALYAQGFVDHLNEQEVEELDDLTCGNFDCREVLSKWGLRPKKTHSNISNILHLLPFGHSDSTSGVSSPGRM